MITCHILASSFPCLGLVWSVFPSSLFIQIFVCIYVHLSLFLWDVLCSLFFFLFTISQYCLSLWSPPSFGWCCFQLFYPSSKLPHHKNTEKMAAPQPILKTTLMRRAIENMWCAFDELVPLPCKWSTKCLSLVVESLSSVVLMGYPRLSLAVGIDQDPPRCLDAQGGIKAKRQPFVVGVVLESCGHGRGRRDVLSWTFCQMLELRILTLHLLTSSVPAAIFAL